MIVDFFPNQKNLQNINCFSNEGNVWKKTETQLYEKKLIVKFNETNLKTDGYEDVFLPLALSVDNICEYTQQTNITNSTFCYNDNLEHRHLTISRDDEFGHFSVFYDSAQNSLLLRRFWALDTDF